MTQRNQSLDLLRGVAILLVVLAHCSAAKTSIVPGLTSFADKDGELGVQLFFIVSGYTMMLTFGDKVDFNRGPLVLCPARVQDRSAVLDRHRFLSAVHCGRGLQDLGARWHRHA